MTLQHKYTLGDNWFVLGDKKKNVLGDNWFCENVLGDNFLWDGLPNSAGRLH